MFSRSSLASGRKTAGASGTASASSSEASRDGASVAAPTVDARHQTNDVVKRAHMLHESLRRIGTMAQATTLFDAHDRPAFTIYKEQRIEVPLDKVSPHLVRALISFEDQRFYELGRFDSVRVLGAVLA